MSTELQVREDFTTSIDVAREISDENRAVVAAFVDVPPDHPALIPFLAIAKNLGLDPLMGEIWLIDTSKRVQVNGNWQDGPKKYSASVGRDGLLKIARNTPSYRGFKSDVVHAYDEFTVEHSTEDMLAPPKVTHRTASPTHTIKDTEGKDVIVGRGPIIGAWAICYVDNRPPVYYFAPIGEHGKTTEKNGIKKWSGSWGSTSAMITKSAVSYVHRLALGVTGILPADEIKAGTYDSTAEEIKDVQELVKGSLWDDLTEMLGEAAATALREKAELDEWAPALAEMTYRGMPEEELRAAAEAARTALPGEADVVEPPAAETAPAKPGEDPEEEEVTPTVVPEPEPLREVEEPPERDAPLRGAAEQEEEAMKLAEAPSGEGAAVEALMHRAADLEGALQDAGSAEETEQLQEELALVEGQIAAAVEPGQDRLL